MSRRKLLVLAASTYQIDTILTAKRLGYSVLTTDNVPANEGHRLADRAYDVDTTDREAVLRIAQTEGIAGIISSATDVAVETAAYVSAALGLRGIPLASASLLTSKIGFREFQRTEGLPHPMFTALGQSDPRAEALLDGRQCLIKPNRSSGSKGVRILSTIAELNAFCDETARLSLDGRSMLEVVVPGSQHTCEGFLSGGGIAFSLITDRATAEPPHTATAGHYVPSSLPMEVQRSALEQIADLLDRLEIREGPFDCDFVASQGKCYVLELAPRLGGNSLSTLARAACGVDLVEAAVRSACGDLTHAPEQKAPRPCAILILSVDRSGVLSFDPRDADDLRREDWVARLQIDLKPSARVRLFSSGRDRVGEALILAESRSELDLRAFELYRRLGLTVEAVE